MTRAASSTSSAPATAASAAGYQYPEQHDEAGKPQTHFLSPTRFLQSAESQHYSHQRKAQVIPQQMRCSYQS